MPRDLLKLPDHLQARVKSELKSGEIIEWIEQPNSTKYMLSGFVFWLFFIPWTTMSTFAVLAAADFKVPDFSQISDFIPVCIFPFVLIGIWGLCIPFSLKYQARNIVYAITNQRAFSIEGSKSYSVDSYSPFQLTRVTRREYKDGSGNLIFLSYLDKKDGFGMKTGYFHNIPNVKNVARIIEKLAANRPAPDSRNRHSSGDSVSYNEESISLSFPGWENRKVFWGEIDLIAISIESNFLPYPYWYVGNKSNLLRIPNDAKGGKELFLAGFSEFIPGYKSESTFKTIIEASTAMEGSFTVWKLEGN